MTSANWQLETPIDAIIFDCDGTLSTLEGIDALADLNSVGEEVAALTAEAMGKSGLSQALYKQRLDLVKPTKKQVDDLGQSYFEHAVPDALPVITLLQQLNKAVYIISAGLTPAVNRFGQLLHIKSENIFAVEIEFDKQGHYLTFSPDSPLVQKEGKRILISELKKHHPRLAFIGDGLNDLAAKDLVTRFIGYGGAYYRENIEKACEFYLRTASLTAILPLLLTDQEQNQLSPETRDLYTRGFAAIQNHEAKV